MWLPSKNMSMALLSSAILLFAVSCTTPQETGVKGEVLLEVPREAVDYKEDRQFMTVTAYSSWTLNIDFGGEDAWARVNKSSGSDSPAAVVLEWDANVSGKARTCTIGLYCEGEKSEVEFSQEAGPSSPGTDPDPVPDDLVPDTPGKWLELPAVDDPSKCFISHSMTQASGKQVRNYSYYLDPVAKTAVWVAYPLNKGLIGSGSRTDEWGYDPKVPQKYQPVLYRGFKSGNGIRYDRGHQLPSADRLAYAANVSTFYFTNMSPQKSELNQNSWAELEGKVRNWCYQMDTLYVVTGADLKGSTEYALDNEGAEIPVPTGYFKALLGYKKGGSIGNSTGGYIGIGFYFEHKSYDNSAIMSSLSMSIDELEEKLGYDFFANLPDKLGPETAAAVESGKDSWWK